MNRPSRNERNGVMISMAILLVLQIFPLTGLGKAFSSKGLDFLFYLRGPIASRTPIVIVEINNKSFKKMPERWMWPRSYHAKIIRQIMRGKPKVIAFDVLFTEQSVNNPGQDNELALACKEAGNVIMAAEIFNGLNRGGESYILNRPINKIEKSICGFGIVNTLIDSNMSIRKAPLLWNLGSDSDNGKYCPSFALATYLFYADLSARNYVVRRKSILIGNHKIPVLNEEGNSSIIINYVGGSGSFKTVPYHDVFNGAIDPSVFKDAVVLVGSSAGALHDGYSYPFSNNENRLLSGVEINANIIETISSKRYIRRTGYFVGAAMACFFAYLIGLIAVRARVWVTILSTMGMFIFTILMGAILFIYWNIYFEEYAFILAAIPLFYIGAITWKAVITEKMNRELIKG